MLYRCINYGVEVIYLTFRKGFTSEMEELFDSFAINKNIMLDMIKTLKIKERNPPESYGYIKLVGDKVYWYIKDKQSRLNGPCVIINSKSKCVKHWKINNTKYREDGPTTEIYNYDENDNITSIDMLWENRGVKRIGEHYMFTINFLGGGLYNTEKKYVILDRDNDIITTKINKSYSSRVIYLYSYGKNHKFYNNYSITRVDKKRNKEIYTDVRIFGVKYYKEYYLKRIIYKVVKDKIRIKKFLQNSNGRIVTISK